MTRQARIPRSWLFVAAALAAPALPRAGHAQPVRAAVKPTAAVAPFNPAVTVGALAAPAAVPLLPLQHLPGATSVLPRFEALQPVVAAAAPAASVPGSVGRALVERARSVEAPVTGITEILAGRVAAGEGPEAGTPAPAERWLETAVIRQGTGASARDWGERSFSELIGVRSRSSAVFGDAIRVRPPAGAVGVFSLRRSAPEGQNAVQKQAPPESKEPVNNPHVPFFAFLLAAAGTAAAGIAYALNSAGEGAPGMLTGFLEYWPLFPWGVFGVRVIRRLANRHVIKEGVVELGFLIALLFWTGLAVAFDINTGGLLRLTVSLAENWFYAVGAVAALAALFVFYEQARYIGWPFRKNKISWFSISPRGIFGALAGAMSALPLFGIAPFASLILPLVGFVVAANYRLPDSETVGNGSTLGFLVGIAAMTHMALLGWPFVAIAFIPALAVALGWFIEAYWW